MAQLGELRNQGENKNSVNSLKIINECKISREKWTRRIVNKCEVKKYNVVFNKRIVLGKGEDTIPYGFHWIPSTNETVVQKSITPVPDSLLYTLIHPSSTVGQQNNGMDLMAHDELMVVDHGDGGMASDDDNEMMGDDDDETMDTDERDIDSMETDDESDNDFESERDSDIEFMDNEYLSEERSFYRRCDNNF